MAKNKAQIVYSPKQKVIRALLWVFLVIFSLIVIFPVLYIILGSFKDNQDLLLGGSNIFPAQWITQNYVDAWEQANFAVYTKNSLILSFGVMIISLIVSSMAGYVFSRKRFPGKEVIYGIFTAFMFINVGSVSLRPLYELATSLKLNTSLWPVILFSAGGGQATYIFLCRGYVNSVPIELDEAARIDGCSFFQTYARIIMPMLKPVLATIAILAFRQGWNEYIMPRVFTMTNPFRAGPISSGIPEPIPPPMIS